jgi:hypothetical protein
MLSTRAAAANSTNGALRDDGRSRGALPRPRPAARRLPRHVKTCIAAGHPRHIRFAKSLIRDQTIAVSLTGET